MPIQDKPRLWVIEMLPGRTIHWQPTVPAYIFWKHARKEYLKLTRLKGDTQYRLVPYEAAESSSPREGKE